MHTLLTDQKYSKTIERSNKLFDNRIVKLMKNQINKQLAAVCSQGLDEGVFAGVSAGVSVICGGHRYRCWFSGGDTRSDEARQPVELHTLFDLASLTKPLCTTLCTLHLIDNGALHWDTPALAPLAGNLEKEKTAITVRHLLQHASGWPAYQPYFQVFPPRQDSGNTDALRQMIIREPLVYEPGSTCVYSDLGFIILGGLIERTTATRLDRLFDRVVAGPLQLSTELHFCPIGGENKGKTATVAATERCPWRGTVLQGEVHDEHSWLMGGVAGHAGLFGTVTAVMTLCECLLDMWKGRALHPGWGDTVLRHALTSKHPQAGWCLGFDTPTPGHSSSGRFLSPHSVGHLGFSGTSFWIDPVQEVILVLLTNRIHPTRENIKIRAFRPLFHDRLMETIHAAS
jgi:CubicO group peptidase (beta-lactamase class C family)